MYIIIINKEHMHALPFTHTFKSFCLGTHKVRVFALSAGWQNNWGDRQALPKVAFVLKC